MVIYVVLLSKFYDLLIYLYYYAKFRISFFIYFVSFSHQLYLIVFHWSLSDSTFLRVFGAFLRIIANLRRDLVWVVSVLPLIFSSQSFFPALGGRSKRPPTTIDITITFMLHSFFSSLTRSEYLAIFSSSFTFSLLSACTTKSTFLC